ncbi:MAG: response regulator, partial [Lentisphaeraceae bacterium]|nr:response regulator [Lentisphaeraceae bacterium]
MIKKKILIVDDNVGFCNTLQKILTKFGYDSEVAHSSGEAMEFLKKDISLFLLDIGLPGSDEEGLKLLREIKAYKPMASVVMITGNQNYEFLVHCISAGASDFFIKSRLDVDYIKKTIDREFEKHVNWMSVMKNIKERTLSEFDNDVFCAGTCKTAFIDDDETFLEMLKGVAAKLHLNADFYSSSEEVLKSKTKYHLVFTDLQLNGSEV